MVRKGEDRDRAVAQPANGEGLADARALCDALGERLQQLRRESHDNPLDNPYRRLAMELSARLAQGDVSRDRLQRLVQWLSLRAFEKRAARLRRYLGDCDSEANEARLRALIRELATQTDDGGMLPFAPFREQIERELFGIVFTAHPTFAMSRALTDKLAALAMNEQDGRPLSAEARAALLEEAAAGIHDLPERLDLQTEHAMAGQAIAHAQRAMRRIYDLLLEEAAQLYPEDWQALTPRLITVASWVGYDLDGRSDIKWSDSLAARIRVSLPQLAHYLETVRAVAARASQTGALDARLAPHLTLLETQLAYAERSLAEDLESLPTDSDDPGAVQAFSQRLAGSLETRLSDATALLESVNQAVALLDDGEARRRLLVLRAEMAGYGLGMAHTQVRLNATQLVNAIRADIGLEGEPTQPGNKRRYLGRLDELLQAVRPVSINFGTLLAERTSARRLFMLVAQMFKYVDRATPVRFLIAECDNAFTALTALYFARLFGIEDRLDISPLFETQAGLQHGHEVIDELLRNEHYRDYVRRRGRLCIQTGFSDAGRYIGQIGASLAIERLRIKLSAVLAAHGLQDLELVIFDTHGESIGRGAHPWSFQDRLDYIATPESRAQFASRGIAVKQEMSFQGGDGYVYFATEGLAFATVTRLLEHFLRPPPLATGDPFYEETDYTLEFFIRLQEANRQLMADADYATLLHAFGSNLTFPTGSRIARRQHEVHGQEDPLHPGQIRAIPHNGILQQTGYLANSLFGLGAATAEDPDRFQEMLSRSPRGACLARLAAYAARLSNLEILAAYTGVLDPLLWLRRGKAETDPARQAQMRRLAELLQARPQHERLQRVQRRFLQDSIDLDRMLQSAGESLRPPEALLPEDTDLGLMHAVRLALIDEIFLLVARLPRFSSQPDVTMEQVLAELLHLDVLPAMSVLHRAFPAAGQEIDATDFGEPASYTTAREQGYAHEHRTLFEPIRADYELVRCIGNGVTHLIGAVG